MSSTLALKKPSGNPKRTFYIKCQWMTIQSNNTSVESTKSKSTQKAREEEIREGKEWRASVRSRVFICINSPKPNICNNSPMTVAPKCGFQRQMHIKRRHRDAEFGAIISSVDHFNRGLRFVNAIGHIQSHQKCVPQPESKRNGSGRHSHSLESFDKKRTGKMLVEKKELGKNVRWSELEMHMEGLESHLRTLLDAVGAQHRELEDVYSELEAERNASATAIDGAMAMISRLQEEKAKVVMEGLQFRRETEQRMAHAQQTLNFYEGLLFRKNGEVEALRCEVQAYKHRLSIYGICDVETDHVRLTGESYAGYTEDHNVNCCSRGNFGAERIGNSEIDFLKNHKSAGLFQEKVCLNEKQNEEKSAMGSCHRDPPDGDPSSREIYGDLSRGFLNPEKEFSPCQAEAEDGDVEIWRKYDKYAVNQESQMSSVDECKRATNAPEVFPLSDNVSPCEQIEKMEKRDNLLTEWKEKNCDLEGEERSTNGELQKAMPAYTSGLMQAHWRFSFTDLCCGSAGARHGEETCGFSGMCADTKQMGGENGRPEPLLQRIKEDKFAIKSKADKGTAETIIMSAPVQFIVNDLHMRIQEMEEERKFMKQTIDSLKKEPKDLKLLKEMSEQQHLLEEPSKSQKTLKKSSRRQGSSLASAIRFLSLGLRMSCWTTHGIFLMANIIFLSGWVR